MEDKYLILSDIHGNVSALDAILNESRDESFAGVFLLGDLIDYGMRSNEVISKIKSLSENEWKGLVFVNIWGNHEKLIADKDLERLSTDRGRTMAEYTAKHLACESVDYIREQMSVSGFCEFELKSLRCLAIHGSLEDHYWKSIMPDDLRGNYTGYDMVFSGHSHYSHYFTHFYRIDNPDLRNRKAVTFVNPGSVGQPRNQNPYAQYAVMFLPSKRVELRAVKYDTEYEQSLYPDELDEFYKIRLNRGI